MQRKSSADDIENADPYADAPAGRPPPKDLRIDYLADLLTTGRYQTRVTVKALGAKWGLTPGTVENDACDANRLCRLPAERREEWREQQRMLIEAKVHEALAAESPQYAAAWAGLALAAKFNGIDLDKAEPKGESAAGMSREAILDAAENRILADPERLARLVKKLAKFMADHPAETTADAPADPDVKQ